MTRLGTIVNGLAMVAVLAASSAVRADNEDTVEYRKHVMKTMGEQAAAIGMILQKKAPADNFATHVKILAITAATAKKAFEPKVPGGDAKPEVWANWADFSKRLDALTAATDDLANTAASGGVSAVEPKMQAAMTCKSCHDNYRVPKK